MPQLWQTHYVGHFLTLQICVSICALGMLMGFGRCDARELGRGVDDERVSALQRRHGKKGECASLQHSQVLHTVRTQQGDFGSISAVLCSKAKGEQVGSG